MNPAVNHLLHPKLKKNPQLFSTRPNALTFNFINCRLILGSFILIRLITLRIKDFASCTRIFLFNTTHELYMSITNLRSRKNEMTVTPRNAYTKFN